MTSPYDILGLAPSASLDDVKQRYKELAKKNHPDKLQHLTVEERTEKEEFFKKVTVAYHVICESIQSRGQPNMEEGGTAPWKHLWSMFSQDHGDIWNVFKNTMSDVATKYQNIHSKEHNVSCNVTLKEVKNKEKRKLRLFLQGILDPVFVTLDCGKYPEMSFVVEDVHTVHIHMKIVQDETYGIECGDGDTIHLTCDVTLGIHEMLMGCSKDLETVDGRTVSIMIPPCMDMNEPIIIQGEGIRGDLLVYVHLKPVSVMRWNALTLDEKENLVRCLERISL